MKFLCIVPIFNEESKLKNLIDEIKIFKEKDKVVDFLLINNGSTDNSKEQILSSKIKYLSFKKNYGVGFALIKGLEFALENNYNYIIHLAGNGKMDPNQITKFKEKILNEKFQFVSGSRFLESGDYSSNPAGRIIMIKILSLFISMLYFRKITDATCGFRAFDTNLFKKELYFLNNKKFYKYRYEYYTIGKILQNKEINFTEIPVNMRYTKKNYSKIIPIIDWTIIILGWLEARFDGRKIF